MTTNINGVDPSDLAEWALAQMYLAMKLAEKSYADYGASEGSIPTDKLDRIAAEQQMHVRHVGMYAAVFRSAESANNSPRRNKYQEILAAVDASLARKQIPRQVTR